MSYTVLPCAGGSGLCTSCERVHFFFVFLDPRTELLPVSPTYELEQFFQGTQ